MSLLFVFAIIPPLFLLYKVYQMDSVEREPLRLILILLIGGAFTTIPAGILESVLGGIPDLFGTGFANLFVENFLIVAVAEEGLKFLVLYKLTWKHSAFDYTFDGVVYAVTVSLGFALAENVLYVAYYGLYTAIVRAFTAIVLHAACGLFMGVYYGLARRALALNDEKASSRIRKQGILVAIFVHGTYDFCASVDKGPAVLAFYVFLIGIYIVAYRKIKKVQSEDTQIDGFSFGRNDE